MNVLISADMEGIAGVVAPAHTNRAHPEYQRFRSLMTAEVNAAIEGAVAAGADRIVVNDSHAFQTNILIEALNPAAELITGVPKPLGMMQGIGSDVDAVFLVGYHARAGAGGGILSHTLLGTVIAIRANGRELGESGLSAAVAGAFGVPVTLVTGDLAVTEEAQAVLGDVETVAVKRGISRTAAQCLVPQVAQARIREAAQRAAAAKRAPFVVSPPVTLSATFHLPLHADLAEVIPGARRVDGCTLEWTGADILEAYGALNAMTCVSMLAELLSH